MTYLVDTDWVIDYLAGLDLARDVFVRLVPDGVAMSLITYIEVFEGIIGGRHREQADAVFRAFLREVDLLEIGQVVANRTALIRADLRQRRRPIDHRAMDLMIAATALAHDLTLVTRNTRDFHDIPGLRLYQAPSE